MVALMDEALKQIRQLPEEEQTALAAWILEELASEKRWAEAFASSPDTLERLADEALREHRSGKTRALIPDEL